MDSSICLSIIRHPLMQSFPQNPTYLFSTQAGIHSPEISSPGKKELGFPTAALLDHWIDYDKRLHENDADYFIVCDKLAFDAAFAASLSPVLKLNNYHFKELENFDLKSENGTPDGKDLLFVSQTISLHDEIKPEY